MAGTVRVTLRRSRIGTKPSQRKTLRALGLRRIGTTVEVPDNPALRGMIRIVSHLVETEE